MEIIRNDDGSLTVPVIAGRHADDDNPDGAVEHEDTTMVLHPGEGGYIEALTEWDLQQNPDRGEAVSTVSGREQAMSVVHAVAEDPKHVTEAIDSLEDPAASAEVVEAEGGEELAPHKATKIIGEVLAEIDARPA